MIRRKRPTLTQQLEMQVAVIESLRNTIKEKQQKIEVLQAELKGLSRSGSIDDMLRGFASTLEAIGVLTKDQALTKHVQSKRNNFQSIYQMDFKDLENRVMASPMMADFNNSNRR